MSHTERSVIDMADLFPCFLSPFGKETSKSYIDELAHAADCFESTHPSQTAFWDAELPGVEYFF